MSHQTNADPEQLPEDHRPSNSGRSEGHVPIFPEQRLLVRPLHDPVLDALGHDPRSAYVEQYWLSVLGPSAVLLLRRLANGIEAEPDGFEIEPANWALELGLGAKGGKHGPFWRSVERICRFGAAQRNGEVLAVRRRLPPLTRRQIERLPEHLRLTHERWSVEKLKQPRRKTISQWSDRRDLAAPPPTARPATMAASPFDDVDPIVSSGRDHRSAG